MNNPILHNHTPIKKIAIQGYEGSFHQEAALNFFGEHITILPCDNFPEVFKVVDDAAQSDAAVIAIENSIVGSILPNYNLLQESKLIITGEIYLNISQNLLVYPGVRIEDVREVRSHHMAIRQCRNYLLDFDWKVIETEDTALSAKHIRQHHSKHVAAIASKLAADMYDLDILAPDIHTMKTNYTRFLVLERERQAMPVPDANKASVNFNTNHSMGSLAKVLTAIADGGINLSKLQSFPIPGSEWLYSFHVDMEFDSIEQFDKVINMIRSLTVELKIYGVYKKGSTI